MFDENHDRRNCFDFATVKVNWTAPEKVAGLDLLHAEDSVQSKSRFFGQAAVQGERIAAWSMKNVLNVFCFNEIFRKVFLLERLEFQLLWRL